MRFGEGVFGEDEMRSFLPERGYEALVRCVESRREVKVDLAEVVAEGMRRWAEGAGAKAFGHWFLPHSGRCCMKEEFFLRGVGARGLGGLVGSSLLRGETDASAFPSGGLRAVHSARGVSVWDPSSYAFVRKGVLCIPSGLLTPSGEALDKRTPLLRSIRALDKAGVRLRRALGEKNARHVVATVGAEQEYFLVERALWRRRPDLVYCGRTLVGKAPPEGRFLHYFGQVRPKISAFWQDLVEELWRLGVPVKVVHNEGAPCQFELAPQYEDALRACDHDQLTMALLEEVAERHGMVCLLHEKPFAGVNGSGKHNNWGLADEEGNNLLEVGKSVLEVRRFLLLVAAIAVGVDKYGDLLASAVATAGNEERLGEAEAPNGGVSLCLGRGLTALLGEIASGKGWTVEAVQRAMQNEERNRTAPIALVGNKLEVRLCGAGDSIADVNTLLNSILAEVLSGFADTLEREGASEETVRKLVQSAICEHGQVIYEGDCYAKEWQEERRRRGIAAVENSAEAIGAMRTEKNVALLGKTGVMSAREIEGAVGAKLTLYRRTRDAEGEVLAGLVRREILPSAWAFCGQIGGHTVSLIKREGKEEIGKEENRGKESEKGESGAGENEKRESGTLSRVYDVVREVESALVEFEEFLGRIAVETDEEAAIAWAGEGKEKMRALRQKVDLLEGYMPRSCYPYPDYGALLGGVCFGTN